MKKLNKADLEDENAENVEFAENVDGANKAEGVSVDGADENTEGNVEE